MRRDDLAVISLFSGALGLDLGLEQAGFRVRVAVECNRFAAQTIRLNRPDIEVLERRIEDLPTDEVLQAARLRVGEPAVLTGGPSCQTFSTAGQRASLGDPRGGLFREFLRVVREARPRFFVMENVRGILSSPIQHRPLAKRGPGFPPLRPEERLGSALTLLLRELSATGYYVVCDLLNCADYGVPQRRWRVVFLGSRDGEPLSLPEQTHAEGGRGGLSPRVTLKEALDGLAPGGPGISFPPSKLELIRYVPPGGNWRSLRPHLQRKALGRAFVSWGGRTGFCRRLAWNEVPPAVTSRPDSKATLMCHPDEDRPLSVRESARLQQFPDGWRFAGGPRQQYLQVGNAVPVGLGAAIGRALRRAARSTGRRREGSLGTVSCPEDLAARIARRPPTVLNPPRMRRVKSLEAARRWMRASSADPRGTGRAAARRSRWRAS